MVKRHGVGKRVKLGYLVADKTVDGHVPLEPLRYEVRRGVTEV